MLLFAKIGKIAEVPLYNGDFDTVVFSDKRVLICITAQIHITYHNRGDGCASGTVKAWNSEAGSLRKP